MENIVITSGDRYIDIDAYASALAYRELLVAKGLPALAVSSAPLNESIPEMIKKIPLGFDSYTASQNDKFIIVDTSDPTSFDRIVNHKNIVEVIDHHTGYEKFWRERPNVKSQIEPIGSIATIIYERFAKENLERLLSVDLCKALVCAVVDNTLNLKANITTARDITAYKELLKLGGLDENFIRHYFETCEKAILSNLASAIKNDTKTMANENLPKSFAQLTIYNHEKVLSQMRDLETAFPHDDWLINLISLKDGKSYIIAKSNKAKSKLEKLFTKKFDSAILTLDKFLLRKEIIALALQGKLH